MTDRKVTDEMLMAFVDGEIDASTGAEVAEAIRRDAELARKAEMFGRTRQLSAGAYADVLSEPVPNRLLETVLGEQPAPQNTPRSPAPLQAARYQRRSAPAWSLPLAACIALALGLGGGYVLRDDGSPASPPGSTALIEEAPELLAALATQPSGEARPISTDGGAQRLVSIVGTYRTETGLCRSFLITTGGGSNGGVRGLACNRGSGYRIELAVRAPAGSTGTFTPASDSAASAIDSYLDALHASPALDRQQEEDALQNAGGK
ncbi:anti-sigma factor family protein [Rhodoligotrophos defluvii]|uniref:anti-sigma factor family protein n=1 Tax=Rhodoligotrophos defluvii TaxID=2561934 RepID=UPI0010C9D7BE|nr:hypothetical protein [Rhodoligotrophos defluvii]